MTKRRERMKQDAAPVDLEELRRLVAELPLDDNKRNDYIAARWLKYVEWWDFRARDAKWKYYALRRMVVIAGTLIPVFVALRELEVWNIGGRDYSSVFAVISVLASLVIAICAGLESLYGFGDIWREKRAAAEIIKSEGFSFFQLADTYSQFGSHKEAYRTFAQNVEQLIRNEIKEYIKTVTPKSDTRPTPNKDEVSTVV
jgi:hypothetical protein